MMSRPVCSSLPTVNEHIKSDYLLSACSELRCERRCVYSADVLSQLLPMRDEVERDTSALIRFEPQENQVVVSGQERQVAAAIRCLDAKACDISATALSHLGVQQSREVFRQGGRNLESEDSSYDSDYELTEPSSNEPSHHDDVSRTVSDTLAAEFAEYVTTTDPHYTSRVEFALKLGYTETQVQIALQKLGCAQPSNNELLAELIKLGAVVTKGVLPVSPVGEEDTMAVIDHFETEDNLRHIVIDGSNVAMSHGNKECFSCRGIKLCVDWFRARGHQNITVFVPRYRKENSRPDAPIKDQEILAQLEKDRLLVFTPSRHVGGRRLVCYDDRYILRLAADSDGVVVSNDNYRDLVIESPDFKKVVENRLLMYSFVNDRFMPPDDPLGRHGPSLDNFLRKSPSRPPESLPPPCPYGKKCTYGNKCKYHHPERGNLPQKSVTERLAEQAKIPLQEVKSRGLKSRESSPGDKLKSSVANKAKKQPLSRTKSLVPPTHDVISEKRDAVERTKSEGSSALKMQQMSYSTTYPWSSTGMPQISLNSDHGGVNAWANVPTTLPLSLPGAADMFLESEGGGGHLFVAKRLSDPDAKSLKPTTQGPPEMGNLHRKLQRQLTLNPAYDPRLGHMPPSSDRTSRLEPPRYNLAQQMLRSSSQENVHLLQSGLGQHQPLNRMGSAGPPLSVWDTHHQTVTRIASAPDSYNQQWPRTNASGRMQHLNSTSDTRLNLYPDLPQHPPYMADVQQHSYPPPLEMQSQHSYPPPVDMQPQQHLQHLRHWLSGSLEPRPMWSHGSSPQVPVRPSSVPPPGLLHPPGGSGRPASPDLFSEGAPRYRLYFHLASIFPKDQVQTVMDMYPQETNPQKICAAILNMFPKG